MVSSRSAGRSSVVSSLFDGLNETDGSGAGLAAFWGRRLVLVGGTLLGKLIPKPGVSGAGRRRGRPGRPRSEVG